MSCLPTSLCLHGRWTNMTEFLCSQYTYNGCMNWTCLNLLNYRNCQDNIYPDYFLNHTCVDECSCSCPVPDSPQSPDVAGFVAFNAVMLLAVVLPVIAVNTAILVALALESSIVKVIRLVLASTLIACLLSALGLLMFHIAEIVLSYSFSVNAPPSQSCTITLFLLFFGAGARLVFMAAICIVVYIIVKHGNATKKRLVIAVLVAVVVLWVITFLGTSPLFSQEVVSTNYYWLWDTQYHCRPAIGSSDRSAYIFLGMYLFFFCVLTPSVAVVFLLIICCNRHIFTSATAVEKTLVKFGFFLFLGSGLNMIGLFVPLVITLTGDHYVTGADPINYIGDYNERLRTLIYAAFTLVNAGVIPTPILILIFFKSIRKRLLRWLCCCMAKKRKAKHNHNNNNNGDGRMVTATV